MQEFPNECYCIPGVLVHTRFPAHVSMPPHCQISRANKDISLTSLSDADLCVEQLGQKHSQWGPLPIHTVNVTRQIL